MNDAEFIAGLTDMALFRIADCNPSGSMIVQAALVCRIVDAGGVSSVSTLVAQRPDVQPSDGWPTMADTLEAEAGRLREPHDHQVEPPA